VTDVIFINPRSSRAIYGGALYEAELPAIEPPLWCRILAGCAVGDGYQAQILDADALSLSAEQVAEWVVAISPDLVVVVAQGHQPSASTQSMPAAYEVCRQIKRQAVGKLHTQIPTAIAGGHVSALPEQTLKDCWAVDYAIVGEGPDTIRGILDRSRTQEKTPGLASRWDGAVLRGPPAGLRPIGDLGGEYGWSLLPPLTSYRAHNWQCLGGRPRTPYASVQTSLGCPYTCSFCCINSPFGSNHYRMRDPYAVINEIYFLYHYHNVRTFKISDEMFVLNPRHYGVICGEIVKRGLNDDDDLNIWAYARVDTVRADKLALLRRAGVRWLALGIESASAYVRDGAQKRLKNDDVLGVVRAIQAAGINVIGNFIFGLPDDDVASMNQTLELALDLRCEYANFYCAMAYPGSPLYSEAVREGWSLPETWDGYSQHGWTTRPLDTQHVKAATVLSWRDLAFSRYFSDPAYLDMITKKFGSDDAQRLLAMSGHRIPRLLLDGDTSPGTAAENTGGAAPCVTS